MWARTGFLFAGLTFESSSGWCITIEIDELCSLLFMF